MDANYMIPAFLRGMIRDFLEFDYKKELTDYEKAAKDFYIADYRERICKYYSELTADELKNMSLHMDEFERYSLSLIDCLSATQSKIVGDLDFMRHALHDYREEMKDLIISLKLGLEGLEIAREEMVKFLPNEFMKTADGIAYQGYMMPEIINVCVNELLRYQVNAELSNKELAERRISVMEIKTLISRYYASLTEVGIKNVADFLQNFKIDCLAVKSYMSDYKEFSRYDLELCYLNDILDGKNASEIDDYINASLEVINIAIALFKQNVTDFGTQGQTLKLQ